LITTTTLSDESFTCTTIAQKLDAFTQVTNLNYAVHVQTTLLQVLMFALLCQVQITKGGSCFSEGGAAGNVWLKTKITGFSAL